MSNILNINDANDYARTIGAPEFHPQVSVIHYDEMGEIPHHLCRFNVYGIFIQKNFPSDLQYGVGKYDVDGDCLLAYKPGQIAGMADNGEREQYHGWVLLFSPAFIYGTEFERKLNSYHFFSYNSNEGLRLKADEMQMLSQIMQNIRKELIAAKPHADDIVMDYIMLLTDLCKRYYDRQFKQVTAGKNDILARFQQVLQDYYDQQLYLRQGVPSVRYCAEKLFMSPSYFGDVIRKSMGQSPLQYIRFFMIERAKTLIASGHNINEVSYLLGFEYPQHFTRVFKKETGMLPSKYVETLKTAK